MIKFTTKEIEQATNAYVKREFSGSFKISTDTRTIENNDLYLPLKGATFDGENFCNNAINAGAAGCFYTKEKPCEFAFKVEDTLIAYLQLAKFARKKYNPKVVGVTGSSGKTTTKEMIYSVLSQKFKTQKTYSNHNNEIGFCQTVLGMNEDTEVLIVEMGMRGIGEIELITKYAQPDFAVITNAGSAHIGRLGSLDNIAKAKCEIASGLKKDGTFIALNQDIIKKHVKYDGEKVYYSLKDVKILEKSPSYSKFEYKGEIYELNVEGDYNIENSLSAIELGLRLKMTHEEIRKGLFSYHPIEKRWEVEKIGDLNVINDSYNANPESMKASVSTFLELYENPVVVLGNMGELGEKELEFHAQVGKFLGNFAKSVNKDVKFITVGDLASKIGEEIEKSGFYVKYFNNNIETSRYILDNINAGSTIFLKASRAMKFEEILENLRVK